MLTRDGCWRGPKCSPDGEWVLCTGNAGGNSSITYLKAFHLSERASYDIYLSKAEYADLGGWSPSGRQFCYTLSDTVSNTRKTAIYISDFTVGNTQQPGMDVSTKPLPFRLIGNYPNPFNSSTTISYSLPSAGLAELIIYNMTGQKVRELVSGRVEAGKHAIVWDGRDQRGNPVSSGVYISRLKMERNVETRRMTLVK